MIPDGKENGSKMTSRYICVKDVFLVLNIFKRQLTDKSQYKNHLLWRL